MYFKQTNSLKVKEWKKYKYHADISQKNEEWLCQYQSRFQIKNITKDKDHFLVINGSFYQEDIQSETPMCLLRELQKYIKPTRIAKIKD